MDMNATMGYHKSMQKLKKSKKKKKATRSVLINFSSLPTQV
jgi:hypothetical protein